MWALVFNSVGPGLAMLPWVRHLTSLSLSLSPPFHLTLIRWSAYTWGPCAYLSIPTPGQPPTSSSLSATPKSPSSPPHLCVCHAVRHQILSVSPLKIPVVTSPLGPPSSLPLSSPCWLVPRFVRQPPNCSPPAPSPSVHCPLAVPEPSL